jgi:hypothetical protein
VFCALTSAVKRMIPLVRAYSARLSNSKVVTPWPWRASATAKLASAAGTRASGRS